MVRSLLRDWAKSWALRFSRGATLCICLLGLLSSSPGVAAAVAEFSFDIPATTLDDALTRFSEQSGYSVGMAGTLPRLRSAPLSGRFTAHQALTTLLAGSGLVAVPLGAAAFRLEPRAQTADRVSVPRAAAQVEALDEVVVTAAKRRQDFRTIPLSMTVVSGDDIDAGMLPAGSRSAHLHDVTTSSTNLGPGRERQFIRGIADSPFLGPSQATVSVQFDDARATYDAPDPDLVLLDIEQVEILKGPQGPLYGTGALGGVFHIVPRRPELDRASWQSTVQLQKVQSGGAGFGADVVVNTPVVPGRAALRAVAYTSTEPGWIDNSGARDNANGTRILGGRLALRTLLPADWTLDLQAVAQNSQTADSQYVTGSSGLRRSGVLPEPHDNDFYLGVATAQGRWLGLNALVTTSAVSHESDGILDANAAAGLWGETSPLRYRDKRRYRLFNEEVRLWSNADARVSWLLGASYVSARSALNGSLEPGQSASTEVLRLVQQAGELAVFGEASMRITGALRATGGLRVFRSRIDNEGRVALLQEGEDEASYSATPSFSLDWGDAAQRRFFYLRYARAVRPGGLNLDSTELRRFAADRLSNVDLGARLLLLDESLSVDSALFATRWSHMQSDYLLDNGLVGTRNVGAGRILGVESSLRWMPGASWRVEGAITLQRARLHESDVVDDDEDRRLPVVPEMRGRLSLVRSFAVGASRVQLRADLNYIGDSRLSFEPALDRRMGNYVRTDLAIQWQRGPFSWTLQLANLLDSRADTFAFGNPFSIRTQSQFTPLKPRTLTLAVGYRPAR
jgi:outer membrane receptor protein involved in Fe transport